jgi:uncharacterized protein (DUF952 family)
MNKLYHIVSINDWKKFSFEKTYFSATFNEEKFIHLSTKEQVEGTLNNYFKNKKKLKLLIINADLITEDLKFEANPEGQVFPHLYAGLSKKAIIEVIEIQRKRTDWVLLDFNF